MSPTRRTVARPRAVTFDCWGTLIALHDQAEVTARRARVVATAAGVGQDLAAAAFGVAWRRHDELWRQGIASGAPEMARWTLEELGAPAEGAADLAVELELTTRPGDCMVLPGAQETLARLEGRGVRRALICDTGVSSGRMVRELLEHLGLLARLEVQIFSNEVGVPKPDPSLFQRALRELGTGAEHAVHVGDLRRTDIAGARGVGMGSVRIRQVHDDQSQHPEADAVAESHRHLLEILAID
jgi:putative hydrolase of the HAD superfamily